MTCVKMFTNYGHVNLKEIPEPKLTVYINNGEKSVWLPLSASEIDITLYLHHKGCTINEIRRHVKRWRKYRKERKNSDSEFA